MSSLPDLEETQSSNGYEARYEKTEKEGSNEQYRCAEESLEGTKANVYSWKIHG